MNTWPDNRRRALTQAQHEAWNADNWPGTRQFCVECGEATGRCEEDGIWNDDGDPLCEDCAAAPDNQETGDAGDWYIGQEPVGDGFEVRFWDYPRRLPPGCVLEGMESE